VQPGAVDSSLQRWQEEVLAKALARRSAGLCPAGQYLKRDDSTSAETSCEKQLREVQEREKQESDKKLREKMLLEIQERAKQECEKQLREQVPAFKCRQKCFAWKSTPQ